MEDGGGRSAGAWMDVLCGLAPVSGSGGELVSSLRTRTTARMRTTWHLVAHPPSAWSVVGKSEGEGGTLEELRKAERRGAGNCMEEAR